MTSLLQTGNLEYRSLYRFATKLLLLLLAYFVSARLGLAIPYVGSHITLIWLPTGIAIAALMRWGYRYWPGIFLGALASNFSIDSSLLLDISISLGNTLAPMLSTLLLRRLKFHASLDRAYDILLLVIAAAIGMLLSASGGVSSLLIFGLMTAQDAGMAWLSWWAGDFIGVLLAAPLLLNISRTGLKKLSAQRVEFLAWAMIMLVISWAVFFLNNDARHHSLPLVFIILPVVVWSAMRFGVSGSALGVLLPAGIAAAATSLGLGPFYSADVQHGLFLLWLFLATLVLVDLMVAALQAESNRASAALQQSELQLRTIIETEPECVKLMSRDGTILQMNPAGLRMLEADTPGQIIGQQALGVVAPQHKQAFAALTQRVFAGESGHLEFEVTGLRGTHRWLETYEVPMRDAQDKITSILGITRDITERKASEAQIQRLINLYAALNQCNQAILRCSSEDELFRQVCRDAVQFGGLQMAWIGLVDESVHMVKPVASYGTGTEYLQGIRISVDADDPHGRGPIGIVLRENRPYWCQDYLNEPLLAPWHERGERSGWAASAALPLQRNGVVVGAFTVYSSVAHVFDEAARNLLEGMATDISYALTRFALLAERKKTEDAMRIAAVAFDAQEGIMITEPDGTILRVNQAFHDITGYSAAEAVGQNPRMLQSGRHDATFYQALWSALLDTGKWMGEIWDKRKSGEIYPLLMTITSVRDDKQQVSHYVAVFRDISNRKLSEQAINQLAFYDPLTRLPNRRLLLDRLQQALALSARNGRHGALLFLDLDHFKIINDTQGHAMGDQLLIEAARRLRNCVREIDSVARLGGDEFVVLLEELGNEADEAVAQTELVAEKIRQELDKPYVLNEFECLSTVSIGISLFRGHRESANDLLQHADVAMYQAKTTGRNAIRFFDPQMQAALDMRAAMEADLRHALDKQQFSLHYQIQVDNHRRPLGAEVLLRWLHPERGQVSPMQFIPVAEDTGLIVAIGLWVLKTACAQLYKWQLDSLTQDLTLAVNVSAKQFRHPDFVAQVQRVLLESGAKPSLLKLELTESTVLENVEDTISKMYQIKALGVSFSMDDFGTGYSSLQYLKRLPLNQIKIDQSFVRDIATDPNDAAIVQTIIAMTEALGLNVIAEGVETEAQLEFIELRGCRAFQGYLFGKPLPIEQFEGKLRDVQ